MFKTSHAFARKYRNNIRDYRYSINDEGMSHRKACDLIDATSIDLRALEIKRRCAREYKSWCRDRDEAIMGRCLGY